MQPTRWFPARLGKYQDRQSLPDEQHAERYHNGGNVPEINNCAYERVDSDATQKYGKTQERSISQQGRCYTPDKADKCTNRQIEIIHRDDKHLSDGGERRGNPEVEHQIKPQVAH